MVFFLFLFNKIINLTSQKILCFIFKKILLKNTKYIYLLRIQSQLKMAFG
jgi:hypothetical protein